MNKKIPSLLAILLCLTLCAQMPISASVSKAAGDEDFMCTYAAGIDAYYSTYGCDEVIAMTAEEAATAGIPQGYSGQVLSVKRASELSMGFLVDFSERRIPVSLLKSVTFRVYVGADGEIGSGYPEIRIVAPGTGGNGWFLRYYLDKYTDQWVDVVVDDTTKTSNYSWDLFAVDGFLNKLEVGLRKKSSGNDVFYVDSITYQLEENDGVAPVISYDGADEITISEGAQLGIHPTAFDAQENCSVEIEYIWPEGTILGESGTPGQGTYTLTLRATDYYGNTSERQVTVIVEEPDNEKPQIMVKMDSIYATVGATPILTPQVVDNREVAEVSCEWSEGAVDKYNRLNEGTHTWAVTAKDTSGNVATKVVTVYVTEEEWQDAIILDEEEIMKSQKPIPTPDPCAGGHTEKILPGKTATSKTTGLTEGKQCSVCGKILVPRETIPKIAKPGATKITKATGDKKKVTIKFKKIKGVSGYEIQLATKKNMKKGLKTKTVKATASKYVAKKLKAKTTYWIRIRTYKVVNKEKIVSVWSKKVKVKTK